MAMSWKHARLGSQQKWIAELLHGLKTYAYLALFVYLPACLSVHLFVCQSACGDLWLRIRIKTQEYVSLLATSCSDACDVHEDRK